MAREKIKEIPVCPQCKKPTDRRCISRLENQNGNGKVLTGEWQCLACKTKYLTSLPLDKP